MVVADRLTRARQALDTVADPEIPVLSIADLGVLRDLRLDGEVLEVVITPTYSGCPAMHVIALDIETTLDRAGLGPARVRTVLAPAWTTDWLSDDGRQKLRAYGIAPPPAATRAALFGRDQPRCPRCDSTRTELISAFGSTACKALHRCLTCREPFDAFKCH
jgi:ring-1,2-phenylacetyl-CoA epoxidase subunit PaaD